MRCEDIPVELDAYSTGELDAETCAEIEQHIRQCPSCLDELKKIREENILYRNCVSAIPGYALEEKFVRYVPPEEPKSLRRFFSASGWRWAAAAMVIMAIGLFFYLQVNRNASVIDKNILAEQLEAVPINQALKDLEQAIVLLQASYQEKKPLLDPDLVKELDQNLEITKSAIHECKEALKIDSVNHSVIELLAFSYQKQIDILKYFSEGLK